MSQELEKARENLNKIAYEIDEPPFNEDLRILALEEFMSYVEKLEKEFGISRKSSIKELTAKEMFENIDYKLVDDYSKYVVYRNALDKEIYFSKALKVWGIRDKDTGFFEPVTIEMWEAIIQQMKELRWIK